MKRFYYKKQQLDGDQKVFDQGFKCGYQKGYRAGLNRLERYMKRVKMFRKI